MLRSLCLGLCLLVAACRPAAPVTLDALPVPPSALDEPAGAAARTRAGLAVTAMRSDLRDRSGTLEARTVPLLEGTTWGEVEAFYEDAFGAGALAAAGFERETAASSPGTYRLAVWERGRRDAVGVAWVEGPPEDPQPVLVLLRSPR